MHVMAWLESIPSIVIYLVVGLVIAVESLGIPLPGEIMLVSGSVAAAQGVVNPFMLAAFAAAGAIIGDSIGYTIGKRYGNSLLAWLGRRAPAHFGPRPVAQAERAFARWGAWAVFGGRFVALLRILAGPIAGILGMRYSKFLVANACGGLTWVATVTSIGYLFGLVAGHWLQRVSWLALVLTIIVGTVIAWYLRHRAAKATDVTDDVRARAGARK